MPIRVFLVLALSLFAGLAQAQSPQLLAELDRSQVNLGETVTLTLTWDGEANMPRADLSALQQDFEVLGSSQRSATRWVNGQMQASASTIITLEPLREGQLTVPPIRVGNQSSRPLSLEVRPAPDPGEEQGEVFVRLRLNPEEGPYRVGQQLQLTVSLYHSVPLASGQLTEPEPDGAELERLGDDSLNEARRGDTVYRVVERQYALIPNRSGELEIPAVRFQGRTGSRAQSFFGEMGRPLSTRSRTLNIQVEEPGPGEPDLPARRLRLLDSLGDEPLEIPVGEAISREVTIEAEGLHADQLPALSQDAPAGLRAYADQPTRDTNVERGWLQASLQQRLAMVAMTPGQYTLPAIEVEWYNVVDQRVETARLPARQLTVLPAAGSAAPAKPSAAAEPADSAETVVLNDAGYWPWLTGLFAALWLATLLLWWWRSRPADDSARQEVNAATRYARRKLSRAAARGDTAEVQEALMLWSRAESLGCRSLSELAEAVDDAAMAEAIRALERHRFGARGADWHAPPVFKQPPATLRAKGVTATGESPLPPLYPE